MSASKRCVICRAPFTRRKDERQTRFACRQTCGDKRCRRIITRRSLQ